MTINELMTKISFYPGVEIAFSKEINYAKITVSKYKNGIHCCVNRLIDESDLDFIESVLQQMIDEVEKMAAKNS